MMSPATSSVKSPASEIVEPFIVISSTVRVVSVPTLVMFGCAAVDKVPASVVAVSVPVTVAPYEVVASFTEPL